MRPGDDNGVAGLIALGAAALLGLGVGVLAQVLRESDSEAVSTLGGGTALWVTIGFLLARRVARTWQGPDRPAWACVAVAAYLLAWLLGYHALFAVHEHLPGDAAWVEARYWVAAVTPACIVIGLAATWSLRPGLLGDVSLALPLGWSLPEAYLGIERGWTFAAVVAVPTIVAGLTAVAVARDRRRNAVTITFAALAIGLVGYLAYPHEFLLG